MSAHTVQEIADKLGLDKTVAYGLVKFLVKAGALEPAGERKLPNAKKGSVVYATCDGAPAKVVTALKAIVE